MPNDTPKIFRITVEVDDLERASAFYAKLFATPGKRHPGSRHYFDCGGVILAVQDVSRGGLSPHANAKSVYFAVDDIEEVHARAESLDALAPYLVHDAPGGAILTRPWQERSFYAVDPWENDLCFVAEGTLYT